jgi:hypothetical protein
VIADLSDLLELYVDLREHLIDVLEPGSNAVVAVVAGVALLPSGQEGSHSQSGFQAAVQASGSR